MGKLLQRTPISNLRPISNLQFVSKITERAVFDQVYSYMTENNLFPVLQSAYRKGHSTEKALLRVVNYILSNMKKQHMSILVLLDLTVAFDTVDHAILLGRLETSFGIKDTALTWFASYLSGLSQCVSVMERGQIVIRCHLVFLRVRVSGPYSSVPVPASCLRSSSCTFPTLTHLLVILRFIFPSTQTTPLVKQRQYMPSNNVFVL